MINYVVYSHTDFLDVLRVQTDYIKSRGNITLLINSNSLDVSDLYDSYDNVIFYEDTNSYATKLLTSINQITLDTFLFLHDNDILLNVDNTILESLVSLVDDGVADRIDLKHTPVVGDSLVKVVEDGVWSDIPHSDVPSNSFCLVPQNDTGQYIYNVNPCIWRKDSFVDLLNNFPEKTYRNIEGLDVQTFCKKFNVYKLNSVNILECGYFKCLPLFTFLHITHFARLLLLNDNYVTEFGQSYVDVSDEYVKIVNKYKLKLSPKWVN